MAINKRFQMLRGLFAKIAGQVLRDAEPYYSTDSKKLYIGDTNDANGYVGVTMDSEFTPVKTTVTTLNTDVGTLKTDVTNIKTDYAHDYTANKVIVSGADGKLAELTGTDGQFVSFNATGVPTAVTPSFASADALAQAEQDIADIQADYVKTSAGGNVVDANAVVVSDADGKIKGVTGTDGQVIVFDANGVPKAQDLPAGGVQKYAITIGDGASTTITITHNLNTTDVCVDARQVANNQNVWVQYTVASVNAITMTFTTAPAAGSIRVVVLG